MRQSLPLCALVFVFGCSGNGVKGGGGGSGGSPKDAFVPLDGPTVTTDGDTVTVAMTPFNVTAGSEVYMCQTFANPFGGVDTEVAKYQSVMSAGSHHMLLLFDDGATNGALTPCSGLTFGPMSYGAQQPQNEIVYPTGIASLIKGTQGFNIVAHYLNATPNDLTASVVITMTKATPGTITQHAGVFFLNNISALLPPNGGIPAMTTKTITASYTTTQTLNILYAVGHMHMRSLSLVATANGAPLYTTDSWNMAPLQAYAPPTVLAAGTTITWACDIDNDTTSTLVFGESAQTNQMCIFDGQYYPADDNSPTISVQR
jgi:hypothetical protein